MKKFLIMPERGRFYTVEGYNAEMVYRGVCSWYNPKTPVAIMDAATGSAVIYTRHLDGAGNLVQIRKAATV